MTDRGMTLKEQRFKELTEEWLKEHYDKNSEDINILRVQNEMVDDLEITKSRAKRAVLKYFSKQQ